MRCCYGPILDPVHPSPAHCPLPRHQSQEQEGSEVLFTSVPTKSRKQDWWATASHSTHGLCLFLLIFYSFSDSKTIYSTVFIFSRDSTGIYQSEWYQYIQSMPWSRRGLKSGQFWPKGRLWIQKREPAPVAQSQVSTGALRLPGGRLTCWIHFLTCPATQNEAPLRTYGIYWGIWLQELLIHSKHPGYSGFLDYINSNVLCKHFV